MPDSEITTGELRRWLTRIDETLKGLVLRVEFESLERRVGELEEGRSSLVKILVTAIVGVVVSAVVFALKTKGGTP